MSTFVTVGVSHRDAPLAELERVAVVASARDELHEAALAAGCAEILVLATCSRVELHAVLDDPCGAIADPVGTPARLAEILLGRPTGPGDVVHTAVGSDAVHHLFRVAAGLDSRVVGEVEVRTQLRASARSAVAAGGEPHRLRRLVAAALTAARGTSAEVPGLYGRSLLARRAVARMVGSVGPGESVEVLVVGAGTMGRQVMDALPGHCRATLLSRTSGARPAHGPRVHPLEELPMRLPAADLVFVATAACRRVVTAALVGACVEGREGSMTIVDLALPRNVEPAVAAVPGVCLVTLDDLSDTASDEPRDPRALAAAETATDLWAEGYCAGLRSRRAGPMINELRARVESVCLDQLRRTGRGLSLPEEDLARMAAAVAGAVAHRPTLLLRQAVADDDVAALALVATAFGLEETLATAVAPAQNLDCVGADHAGCCSPDHPGLGPGVPAERPVGPDPAGAALR